LGGDGPHQPLSGAARLQPLLTAAAVGLVVPYLVAIAAPWPVLLYAVLVAGWALHVAWQRRRGKIDARRTEGLAWTESVLAVAGVVLLLVADAGRNPTAAILLAAGVVATFAILRPLPARVALQGTMVVAVTAAVGLARGWVDAGFVAALLLVVVLLSSGYAAEQLAASLRERAARRDAELRSRLLATVEALPADDVDEALQSATHSLLELGYDGAAVELRGSDGDLQVAHLDGLAALPSPRRGEGFGWRCIATRRTITTTSYVPGSGLTGRRPDIHAVVATPIMVAGEPIGALLGFRTSATMPSTAEAEIAEVLAAHLGAVLGTLRREQQQQDRLEVLARLQHLRAGVATALAAELRGPLADIHALHAASSPLADAPANETVVAELAVRAADLTRAFETVLDTFRAEVRRTTSRREPVAIEGLLRGVAERTGARVLTPPDAPPECLTVMVDAALVDRAIELLLTSGPGDRHGGVGRDQLAAAGEGPSARLSAATAPGHLAVHVDRSTGAPTPMARLVAARLLRAGGGALDDTWPNSSTGCVVRLPTVEAAVSSRRMPIEVFS
jgi:K+-sensing histidine kinase KdpD